MAKAVALIQGTRNINGRARSSSRSSARPARFATSPARSFSTRDMARLMPTGPTPSIQALRRYADAVQQLQLGNRVRHGDGSRLLAWQVCGLHVIKQALESLHRFGQGERARRGFGAGGGANRPAHSLKTPRLRLRRIVLVRGRTNLATGQGNFAQVTDDRRSGPPNSLLLRASNEVLIGNAKRETRRRA